MEKIKKWRKIILGALILFIVLDLSLISWRLFLNNEFMEWAYDKYGTGSSPMVEITEPSIIGAISWTVIIFVIGILFSGLATKYSISKSPKIQGRKWPYIVLLIFAVILCLIWIYSLVKSGKKILIIKAAEGANQDLIDQIQNEINNKIDNSYSLIFILKIVSPIIEFFIIALNVLALVWISKMKNEKDSQMTNEVLQTGLEQNNNDLP